MNQTLTDFYAFWSEWFAQSEEAKRAHLRQPGRGGYYPRASESPGFTGNPDPKEYFHWRPWRDHPERSGSPVSRVFFECLTQARRWLVERGLPELANLPSENHVLRILHYFPTANGHVGEAHRDFNLLTVSVEGTHPGLEVWATEDAVTFGCVDGLWLPQETGVQVGEMLEIYTNPERGGTLQFGVTALTATTHRVCTEPNVERLKAVFFYLPPEDFELRPGFTAKDYLYGPNGVMHRAGTAYVGASK